MSLHSESTMASTPRTSVPFRQRVGRYALPLVAVPTTLMGASSLPLPSPPAPVQASGQRPTALSAIGLDLDRRLLSHLAELADARSGSVFVDDEVYALLPKSVRRYRARLVRVTAPLPMVDDEDELRLQTLANE